MGYKWAWLALMFCAAACKENEQKAKLPVADSLNEPAMVQELQSNLQPDNEVAIRARLADVYDSIGQPQKGVAQLDSLLAKDKANHQLWLRRGQLAQAAGDTLGAFRSFDEAARIYPSIPALLSLANLYAEMGNPRSLQLANQVEKMNPERQVQAHAKFVAGVFNARKKQWQQAIPLFDRCIQLNYTYMEAYIEKALAQAALGQPNAALKTMELAAKINSLYADNYYFLGKFHEQMGQRDSAILRYEQALGLDPNMKEADAAVERLRN